jgi:hypothetical protein
MSTKTEQELHVERELELFEHQNKHFTCKGARESNLALVVKRMEAAATTTHRTAEAKARQAERATALGNAEEAKRLTESAETQQRAAERLDYLVGVVLESAKVTKELFRRDVTTEDVIGYLQLTAKSDEAKAISNHARTACGQDLRRTIAALPRPCDGASYTCPKCGREGHASKESLSAEQADAFEVFRAAKVDAAAE